MKKNLIYTFSVILFILLIISFNCTENGVECGLVGAWELTDYDSDNDYYYEDIEGELIIYNNDTYDLDMKFSCKGGGEIKIVDTGTTKACSINKLIQFFSDRDNDYDQNARYILNGNTLILEDEQHDILMNFQKIY